MSTVPAALRTLYDGWANYHRLVVGVLRERTPDELGLRPGPGTWAVWQLAGHMAGARAYWLHDVLGEGDAALRDRFRVAGTTVPDLPLEDAGWEDDEDHPRDASELVDALERTWSLVEDCLGRWTLEVLAVEVPRHRRGTTRMVSRQWVVWHLIEHDLHHGGEISLILGSHGLPALEL
jgi:uncharacterized damage-inducible protein DinB